MQAGHKVLVLDLPGFGASSKPARGSYTAPWFAEAMVQLMDAMGIERADMVGNSLGGRVAIEIALRRPERVGSLVLLCPAVAFVRRDLHLMVRLLRPEFGLLPHRFARGTLERQLYGLFGDRDAIDPQVADVVRRRVRAHLRARDARGSPSCRRRATSTSTGRSATAASTRAWRRCGRRRCSCGASTTG